MIIGIDARVLEEGNGGIFVYTKSLLDALIPIASQHTIKLFANKASHDIAPILQQYAEYDHVELHRFTTPNKFLNASFLFFKKPHIDIKIGGCDVYFLPSMLYGAWSKDVPLVLTMHDISFALFDGLFTWKQQLWHRLVGPQTLCERAQHIIAVSEATKKDVIRTYAIPKEKITTIHSGIAPHMQPHHLAETITQVRKKYELPEHPYFIQVGTFEPRKNYEATIQAFSEWKKQYPQESSAYHLVLAGHAGWKSERIFKAIEASAYRSHIHVITDFDFKDLPVLYSEAYATLYPSLYEGFGFPPLESMACGTPVITTDNSSLGEVVENAGILASAHRIDTLVSGIHALVSDKDLYTTLVTKGFEQSKKFQWETTATKTLQILEHAGNI